MTYDKQLNMNYVLTAFNLQNKSECLFIAPQWFKLILLLWRESETRNANSKSFFQSWFHSPSQLLFISLHQQYPFR